MTQQAEDDVFSAVRKLVHRGEYLDEIPGLSEPRLRETSLYRPDLDLVVFDSRDDVAAYGLFWYDPATATGVVEPMRTEDEHQSRGLARHILTTGVDLLAEAGAKHVKICFEPDNPAAKHLYLSAGFEPDRHTVLYAGRTTSGRFRSGLIM